MVIWEKLYGDSTALQSQGTISTVPLYRAHTSVIWFPCRICEDCMATALVSHAFHMISAQSLYTFAGPVTKCPCKNWRDACTQCECILHSYLYDAWKTVWKIIDLFITQHPQQMWSEKLNYMMQMNLLLTRTKPKHTEDTCNQYDTNVRLLIQAAHVNKCGMQFLDIFSK